MIYRIPDNKKLWNGRISVRDYVVKKCYDDQEPLVLVYLGKRMTLRGEQLRQYTQWNTKQFASKINGKTYSLLDYAWLPDNEKGKPMSEQLSLFWGAK